MKEIRILKVEGRPDRVMVKHKVVLGAVPRRGDLPVSGRRKRRVYARPE